MGSQTRSYSSTTTLTSLGTCDGDDLKLMADAYACVVYGG